MPNLGVSGNIVGVYYYDYCVPGEHFMQQVGEPYDHSLALGYRRALTDAAVVQDECNDESQLWFELSQYLTITTNRISLGHSAHVDVNENFVRRTSLSHVWLRDVRYLRVVY